MKFKVLFYFCLLGPIKLVTPAEVFAPLYSSATLPCSFSLSPPVNDSLLDVSWSRNGSVVAPGMHTGFYLDTSGFINGSFPLTVRNATLSQQGEYECRVSYNSTEHSRNVTLVILAPPSLSILSTEVVLDRESVVECRAEGFIPPQISFSWTRAGEGLQFQSLTAVNRTESGFFRAVNQLAFVPKDSDRNVTFACAVRHIALKQPLAITFKPSFILLPSVSLSVVPSSSRSSPLTLSCDVSGFYPGNVSVAWVQNGSVLPQPPLTEQNLDGTYRTGHFHTLSVEERDRAGEVRCVVHQPHVSEPAYASVNLSAVDPLVQEPVLTKSAKASVALMIISLVLVFLLCFGFSWRRRDEKKKYLNVSAIILPPRVVVGQKGRVTISVEGRSAERVQVTWLLNDEVIVDTSYKGPRLSVVYPQGHTPRISRVSVVSEKGLLLPPSPPGYYKLHTQQPLHSSTGSKQLLSSLTFIPNLSIHKGAVFKCQVSYRGKDKVVAERVTDKFTLLAAPEVTEIQLSEPSEDTDIVTLTAQASLFHPDIITFRWFCEGGELTPVSAPMALAAPWPDTMGFFSAMSQCRLPRAELERGETRVWVSVHHIALKQPITRETYGFIKRPSVSEITSSPSSSSGRPLTLGCDITGFYPPDVSVTWLRLRERRKGAREEGDDSDSDSEEEEEEEIEEGSEIWGPLSTDPRTFRTTAILGAAAVQGIEQGGRVVCRVQHCSLQHPIERVWRDVHIVPPAIPPSLSVRWSSEGVGVYSLLLSGGKPDATLLWAAGGSTLSQLLSKERARTSEEGKGELRSVCALVMSMARQTRGGSTQTRSRRISHTRKSRTSVVEREAEVQIINEGEDGKKKSSRSPEMKGEREAEAEESKEDESEDEEKERGVDPSYINTVYVTRDGRGEERERLRVMVEITHPAFTVPVYRTWTEPEEEVSS